MPRAWALKHLDGWGHEDWTALVSGLQSSLYWPLKAEEMGTYLETLRDELRAERERQREATIRNDPLLPAPMRSGGEKMSIKLPGDVKARARLPRL